MANRNALVGVFFIFCALVFMVIALATPIWQHRKTEVTGEVLSATVVTTTVAQIGLLAWRHSVVVEDGDGDLQVAEYHFGSVSSDDNNDAKKFNYDADGEQVGDEVDVPKSVWSVTLRAKFLFLTAPMGRLVEDSVDPGAAVLGTGIVALLMGFIGFISMVCVQCGKGPDLLKCATYVLFAGATFFLFIGCFVYAKAISVGYSFFFFAAGGIFVAMGIFQLITVGTETIKAKYGAAVFLFVALLCLIIGMSTNAWVYHVEEGDPNPQTDYVTTTTYEYGLLGATISTEVVDSEGGFIAEGYSKGDYKGDEVEIYSKDKDTTATITKAVEREDDDEKTDVEKGGEAVLGCGIPAVICTFVCFVIAIALGCGKDSHPLCKCAGFIVGGISCGLIGLGLFLYTSVVSTGASFILYFLAGFLFIPGAIFGFSEGEQRGDSTTSPEGGETTKV